MNAYYTFTPSDTKYTTRKNYYSRTGCTVILIKIKKCGTYLVRCLDDTIFECPKRHLTPQ